MARARSARNLFCAEQIIRSDLNAELQRIVDEEREQEGRRRSPARRPASRLRLRAVVRAQLASSSTPQFATVLLTSHALGRSKTARGKAE